MPQDGWADQAPNYLLVIGPNGQFVKIFFDPLSGPIIEFQPPDRAGWTYTQGHLLVTDDANKPWIQLESPGVTNDPGGYNANRKASIYLFGESSTQPMLALIQSDVTIIDALSRIDLDSPTTRVTSGPFQAHDTVLAGPNLGDLGRGLYASASAPGNSAAIPNGFTTVLTTGAIDWAPNRAYMCVNVGRYQCSANAMNPNTAVSNGAQTLCLFGQTTCPLAASTYPHGNGGQNIFTTPAGTLNRNLLQRISSNTAGQTVTVLGPRMFNFYDIGPASAYPDMPVMV